MFQLLESTLLSKPIGFKYQPARPYVVAMLAAVLAEAGLNVGSYTSPHVACETERVRVGGSGVAPSDLREMYRMQVAAVQAREVRRCEC